MVSISKRTLSLILVVLALAAVVAGCDWSSGTGSPDQQQTDQQDNAQAAVQTHAGVPYPQVKYSDELQNQHDRYLLLNNPSTVGYVYVIAYNLVFGPYQVKGKCSSTESLFSSPVSLNTDNLYQGNGALLVPAPQPDGSYGQNETAIFCFLNDANHTYVEFNSQWIYTTKPLIGMPTVPGSGVVPNGK